MTVPPQTLKTTPRLGVHGHGMKCVDMGATSRNPRGGVGFIYLERDISSRTCGTKWDAGRGGGRVLDSGYRLLAMWHRSTVVLRLFLYRHHLSGNNRRDSHFMGS